jgi:hypothetical protein
MLLGSIHKIQMTQTLVNFIKINPLNKKANFSIFKIKLTVPESQVESKVQRKMK